MDSFSSYYSWIQTQDFHHVASSLQSIANGLSELKESFAKKDLSHKSFWENEVLFGVILGFVLSLLPTWLKTCSERKAKIKASLAAFEHTRMTLIKFITNQVIPYQTERANFKKNNNIKNDNQWYAGLSSWDGIKQSWNKLAYPFRKFPLMTVDRTNFHVY